MPRHWNFDVSQSSQECRNRLHTFVALNFWYFPNTQMKSSESNLTCLKVHPNWLDCPGNDPTALLEDSGVISVHQQPHLPLSVCGVDAWWSLWLLDGGKVEIILTGHKPLSTQVQQLALEMSFNWLCSASAQRHCTQVHSLVCHTCSGDSFKHTWCQ